MSHFSSTYLNSFNICFLFSGGIIISSAGFFITILSSHELVTAILFPKNLPVLSTIFLEIVFKEASPVSNNCFLYFLANNKNLYPLTYVFVLGSIEYPLISIN